jgi:hypothetical protein
MGTPTPVSFDPSAMQRRALRALGRACLRQCLPISDPRNISRDWHQNDRVVEALTTKGAVTPASMTDTTALQQISTVLVDALTPLSAGAALLAKGLRLQFNGAGSISVPSVSLPSATFVKEADPLPVVQATSTAATLNPFKIGTIIVVTSEMVYGSDAEELILDALMKAVAQPIDTLLFSNSAGVAHKQPPGLLYSITPVTAATGGTNEAMVKDLSALAAAVAAVAGTGGVVLVAAPQQATALTLRSPRELTWPVLASAALAPGVVIAIATPTIVSATDSLSIDRAESGAMHMDTAPGPLVSASPTTVSAPQREVFQTDTVAFKLRLPISWALRDPRGAAWVSGATW